ncbi:hypothetical protein F2Q70_00013871 [Brassica cretica]|uniref:Uncharacterized protein n=1 Tax=Brassica cretica TaxID=69181 RepID=A0A8S9LTK2_BRACR|nr:hypothetical protein F2Q70_00013871 [Brassica cretica]
MIVIVTGSGSPLAFAMHFHMMPLRISNSSPPFAGKRDFIWLTVTLKEYVVILLLLGATQRSPTGSTHLMETGSLPV